MTARLEQLWLQLVDFFRAQPPARRVVLVATGVGALVAVLALAWWVQRPLYRPLFTNLAERDASAIVEALRTEKDFLQRLNYHRALQGELGRIDESGRMLTTDRRGGETAGASSTALEMQAAIERQLAERVESMLAAVVGRDKAVARVAATLEVARVERTEETYDPERTALRMQRTTREATNDPAAAKEPERPRTERRDESQSFEVSKVVSHTVAPAGVVKQLSVAVLIDGTYTGKGTARKFTPRPAEELERLKELVKNAIGFSEARGDRIEVTSVPFQTEPPAAGEGALRALGTWFPALLMRLLAVGLAAAALFYVVRPLVLGLVARGSEGRAALPEAAAQVTRENLALTQQNPERAAQLVREWLREGAPAIEG